MPSRKREIKAIQQTKPIFSNFPFRDSDLCGISRFIYRSRCFTERLFDHSAQYGNALFVLLARLQMWRSKLTDKIWNLSLQLIKQWVLSHVLLTIFFSKELYSTYFVKCLLPGICDCSECTWKTSILATNFDGWWQQKPKNLNNFQQMMLLSWKLGKRVLSPLLKFALVVSMIFDSEESLFDGVTWIVCVLFSLPRRVAVIWYCHISNIF